MCVCVCLCVRARVRACARVCVYVCGRARTSVCSLKKRLKHIDRDKRKSAYVSLFAAVVLMVVFIDSVAVIMTKVCAGYDCYHSVHTGGGCLLFL